jgi:hypothetical protein
VRVLLAAVALVVVVVGAFWLALALLFSHSRAGANADAFARSAACLRDDRSLSGDRADAARLDTPGLRTLGLRWHGVRAVALFADSSALVTKVEARVASGLRNQHVSAVQVGGRLLSEDDVGLFYVSGSPSQAAQAAIGRCVFLIRFNRFASFFGVYVSPHADRPFLPGGEREH